MSEPRSLDPFALMRDLLSKFEQGANEYGTPLLKSQGFVMGANKAMSSMMVAKKQAQDLRQRGFEVLDVPSRTDVLALADRLQAIEDRLIGMQATLDRLAGGGGRPVGQAPSRMRQPPQPQPGMAAPAAAPKRTRTRKAGA